MGEIFKSNDYLRAIYKHKNLPVYVTYEFDFYRCVEFNESFYGKSVYELHEGNLRECRGGIRSFFLINVFLIGQILPILLEQK